MTGDSPIPGGLERRCACPAIFWILARPENHPLAPRRWREQRFGSGTQIQINSEIHEQQTVVAVFGEVSQEKRLVRQNGAVYSILFLSTKYGFFPAEPQQITMQRVDGAVSISFAVIQLATLKGCDVRRVGKSAG